MKEKEKLLKEFKDRVRLMKEEDICISELERLLRILNAESYEEHDVILKRILTFEEVAEYIYSKLLEGNGELQEELLFYSDFLEGDNDDSTVGNGIGVRTLSFFDEFDQRMLVIGVYGEDFTSAYSYCKDELLKEEVLVFVKTWLYMMRHQLGNNRLIVKEI